MTKLVNRAKMTTATTGTGTITLGTAEAGYQSFADAGVVDADVVRYVIEDGTNWEIGTGTYTATGTTLTRTVSESSNADAAISLTGSAVVYVSAAAEDIPPVLELYAENPVAPAALPSATGDNGIAIGDRSIASGFRAISLGDGNASGRESIAIQIDNNTTTYGAKGLNSIAIGRLSVAAAQNSIAIGQQANASNTSSSANGVSSVASGVEAHSLTNSYASGTNSFAAAIANNTSTYGATGANSVAIGDRALASGANAFAFGELPIANATYASALGGFTNFAIAEGATVLGGAFNRADGPYSVTTGTRATTRLIYGNKVHASGRFNRDGDAQSGSFVLRSDTSDATAEPLTTNNSTAGTTNQVILPNNSAYAFSGIIVARENPATGTACAAWKIEGLIRREGSAGTTVLVNSATTVLDNTPAWGMALSADTTNGGLAITVTGAAATNIRWVATINTSEVTH